MSKKNDWAKTVLILGVLAFIIIIFTILWTTKVHFNVNGRCRFENIEYVDLAENVSCWNDDDYAWETRNGKLEKIHTAEDTFLNEHCPMPQTVDCNFDLIMPLNIKNVIEMVNEIN